MTGTSRDDFDFPTGRWLLYGVIAVGVLAVLILGFVALLDDGTEETAAPADQMEWSIVLTDFTGDTITLKGDRPLGYPTETWQNDFQVARAVNGDFGWNLDLELPLDVVAADEANGCDELNVILAGIAESVGDALEPQLWQARAFAQHTIEVMRSQGCSIDEDLINSL